MLSALYALVTVLAWGTWLAPSQRVPLKNQQTKAFYVAAVNLGLASLVAFGRGQIQFSISLFWPPFLGGIIWAASGLCAFTAADRLGMARAFGIWAPLNIMVSLICGWLFFHEFSGLTLRSGLILALAVSIILAGVLLIIFAKEDATRAGSRRQVLLGLAGALGAGVLWGIYFIPIKISALSLWEAAWPMAVGMFAGSALLVLGTRQSVRLAQPGDYGRIGLTGLLWTVGNYGMLLLVDQLGAGKGYTIAQLALVVNALVGIYCLKDPPPKTQAARRILLGCVMATIGGILLGRL